MSVLRTHTVLLDQSGTTPTTGSSYALVPSDADTVADTNHSFVALVSLSRPVVATPVPVPAPPVSPPISETVPVVTLATARALPGSPVPPPELPGLPGGITLPLPTVPSRPGGVVVGPGLPSLPGTPTLPSTPGTPTMS